MLLSVSILMGCQSNSVKHTDDQEAKQQTFDSVIKTNRDKWDAQVNKAKKINTRSYSENASYIAPNSLSEMKEYKKPLIKGTIVNYKQMSGINYDTYTKATVKVDKVLMGDDKRLDKKTITIVLHGGLIKSKRLFHNMSSNTYNGVTVDTQPDDLVYFHDTDVPLPEIGSHIITAVDTIKYSSKDSSAFIDAMRKNDIKSSTNAYVPYDPISGIWVKTNHSKEYVLNNENWRNITDPNNTMSRVSITKEINNKYNN